MFPSLPNLSRELREPRIKSGGSNEGRLTVSLNVTVVHLETALNWMDVSPKTTKVIKSIELL